MILTRFSYESPVPFALGTVDGTVICIVNRALWAALPSHVQEILADQTGRRFDTPDPGAEIIDLNEVIEARRAVALSCTSTTVDHG